MFHRILLITHVDIHGYGGGSIENRKVYYCLKHYAREHGAVLKMVGPNCPLEDQLHGAQVEKTARDDVLSRLSGHSTYLYFVWRRIHRIALEFQPEIVVLGRSRMGFIARDIKRQLPNCKVIVQMENIELDYVDAYFANRTGLKKWLLTLVEKFCVWRDETMAMRWCDALDFLTERDRERAHQLYKFKDKIETVIPVCIQKRTDLTLKSPRRSVVFIGSLDYGSNLDALMWFIETVWEKEFLTDGSVELIVGGSNAANALVKKVGALHNARLHNNFKSIQDVVPFGALMIAPIRSGAGMKVKIAESLSMGLMIAASDEAIIGYEAAMAEQSGGIIRANTAAEYVRAIRDYLALSEEELERISEENKGLYERHYSYPVACDQVAEIIDALNQAPHPTVRAAGRSM